MKRATCLIAALVAASSWATQAAAAAATGPPLASSWNIAASGSAESSGDLEFRITPADGSNPIDISVAVISGANQDSVARSINRALSSQLRRDRYSVQLGENSNVLVSDPRGRPNFSVELVDSGIENVRVAVKSVTPSAPPTVPEQAIPATPPATPRPAAIEPAPPPMGSLTMPNPTPPPGNSPSAPASQPPASSPPPTSNPSSPNTGEIPGAPASAPPPN
jgi:hypothetical protein